MSENTQIRLRRIMSERNLKQRDILEMSLPYQKKYGIKMGKSALSQYVNGKSSPDQHKLFLLGATLGVDEAWLMGLDVPKQYQQVPETVTISRMANLVHQLEPSRQTKVYKFAEQQLEEQETLNRKVIPLVGKTAANPSVLEYGDVDIEQQSFAHIPDGADCAIIIQGDSMEPLIKNGEIVFYKRQEVVENCEIAIVEINGDGVTCKKVFKDYDNKKIILRSVNDNYEDRILKDEEVRIIGKVIL